MSPRQKVVPKIPDWLVYEMVDGKPIYYKNYQQLLENFTDEQPTAMPESTTQIWLKTMLNRWLFKFLEPKGYDIFSGELGLIAGRGDRRGADISIYREEDFVLGPTFSKIPPEVIIEIDVKAELGNQRLEDYIERKNEDYHRMGVKKVIWIFTAKQEIMVAEVGKKVHFHQWTDWVETIEGASFNLAELMRGKKFQV